MSIVLLEYNPFNNSTKIHIDDYEVDANTLLHGMVYNKSIDNWINKESFWNELCEEVQCQRSQVQLNFIGVYDHYELLSVSVLEQEYEIKLEFLSNNKLTLLQRKEKCDDIKKELIEWVNAISDKDVKKIINEIDVFDALSTLEKNKDIISFIKCFFDVITDFNEKMESVIDKKCSELTEELKKGGIIIEAINNEINQDEKINRLLSDMKNPKKILSKTKNYLLYEVDKDKNKTSYKEIFDTSRKLFNKVFNIGGIDNSQQKEMREKYMKNIQENINELVQVKCHIGRISENCLALVRV